jgi:uncharacterized coiled-coil protein SlyX
MSAAPADEPEQCSRVGFSSVTTGTVGFADRDVAPMAGRYALACAARFGRSRKRMGGRNSMDHLTSGHDGPEEGTPRAGPPDADEPAVSQPPATDLAETAAYPAGADGDAAHGTAPIETSGTVATEVVETPPVKIAAAPGPAGPRRVGSRLGVVVGVLGILAIGGVTAFGYSLNQDLTSTRATLATTETNLGSTRTTLDQTSGRLDETTADLSAATEERTALDDTIEELSAEVASQTECVTLQGADLDELARISGLQNDNFNRTSETSTWAKAADRRVKAVHDALDAYYQAYSKAFDGALSSARAWAQKGKDAEAVIAAQAKQQAAELALIDRSAAEIQAALDALEKRLTSTEATCREVAP